jgi:hypothetical protein
MCREKSYKVDVERSGAHRICLRCRRSRLCPPLLVPPPPVPPPLDLKGYALIERIHSLVTNKTAFRTDRNPLAEKHASPRRSTDPGSRWFAPFILTTFLFLRLPNTFILGCTDKSKSRHPRVSSTTKRRRSIIDFMTVVIPRQPRLCERQPSGNLECRTATQRQPRLRTATQRHAVSRSSADVSRC